MSFFESEPREVHYLELDETERGAISMNWLHMVNNPIGEAVRLPIMVARGSEDGPVVGLTAAIHGNELNGISVIQRFFSNLDPTKLRGTVVGVLVVNVPGLIREQRSFNDGVDLNRITPGNAKGNISQVYIHRFIERILKKFDYHLDLHTASFGRVNSYYVRADMNDARTSRLARLQNPDIIVHNEPNDRTLRGAASGLNIPSITMELRDPHLFQDAVVEDGLEGVRNVLYDLKMMEGQILCPVQKTIQCDTCRWMYTDEGGILQVFPKVRDIVVPGQEVARVSTIFGRPVKSYHAEEVAIIVGRSVNPLNQTGSRIVNLGINPREIPCITDED